MDSTAQYCITTWFVLYNRALQRFAGKHRHNLIDCLQNSIIFLNYKNLHLYGVKKEMEVHFQFNFFCHRDEIWDDLSLNVTLMSKIRERLFKWNDWLFVFLDSFVLGASHGDAPFGRAGEQVRTYVYRCTTALPKQYNISWLIPTSK